MRETPSPEQWTEWRRRMVEAIISRAFDDETLAEMLMAGFDEAHTEGLLDAADICRDIAEASPPGSRVARVLEKRPALPGRNERDAVSGAGSTAARGALN